MLHKAWNSKGEMPYRFPRSSVKFQGHTVQNITDFDQNWAFPDYRPVAAFKSLRFALLFQVYCVWSMLSQNKSFVLLSRSGVGYSCPLWRLRDQESIWKIQKYMKIKNLNLELGNSWMYSLYLAHVIWYHCCTLTENYYFIIFGIEWDREYQNCYLWSSQSCAMQMIGLIFIHKLKKKHQPNGQMTAATRAAQSWNWPGD